MRIIGGTHRGRPLTPLGKGDDAARLRPTSDRVREALFNLLAARELSEGRIVLDLFAGTGALGFEALSRGAAAATFVESGRVGQGLLRRNADLLGLTDRVRIVGRDATRLGTPERAHDLVFLDPPYGRGLGERAMAALLGTGWIATGASVVWEEAAPADLPPGLIERDRRRYGDTWITVAEVQ